MKNLAKEGARITLQISASLLQRLQEAADLRGIPLKQFVVQAAQREADRIIGREKVAPTPDAAAPPIESQDQSGSENGAVASAPEHDKQQACNDAPADDAPGGDKRDCA